MPRDERCPACGQDTSWCAPLEQTYFAQITSVAVRMLLDPVVHTRQATANYLRQHGWIRSTRTSGATAWILLTKSEETKIRGTKVRIPAEPNTAEWAYLMAELVFVIADITGVGELRILAQIEEAGRRVHA